MIPPPRAGRAWFWPVRTQGRTLTLNLTGALIFLSNQHYLLIRLIQPENQTNALLHDVYAQNLEYADLIAAYSGGGQIHFLEVGSGTQHLQSKFWAIISEKLSVFHFVSRG